MHRKFFEAAWLLLKAVKQREIVLFTFSESIADFMKIQEIFLLVVHGELGITLYIKIRCSPSTWNRLDMERSQSILEVCLKYPMEQLPVAQAEDLGANRQDKVVPASHGCLLVSWKLNITGKCSCH